MNIVKFQMKFAEIKKHLLLRYVEDHMTLISHVINFITNI